MFSVTAAKVLGLILQEVSLISESNAFCTHFLELNLALSLCNQGETELNVTVAVQHAPFINLMRR